jgi:inhibitor of cysteine peptidase
MLVIDQTQNNASVEIAVGDSLRVQLSENPTTGYRWQLLTNISPTLRLIRDEFEASASGPGGGGVRYWIVQAEQFGTAALSMELRRSWQPQPVNSFAVSISVKAR